METSNSILNAFKSKFATKVNSIYVNSLKRNVNFREVSVTEQKTLSKTIIENENRKDIVYDTQCALINRLCLENDSDDLRRQANEEAKNALPEAMQANGIEANSPAAFSFVQKFTNNFVKNYLDEHGFDIYRLTEFDRIRILMEIYQNNYFKREITYKCPHCGNENKYQLDFTKIIEKFNNFSLENKTYTLEDDKFIYNFVLNYPTVRSVSNFYKNYMKQYKGMTAKEKEAADDLANIEYVNLYIKQIELIDKATNEKNVADLTLMSYDDTEKLIAMFPENIIFSDTNGVLKEIASQFMNSLNDIFKYETCAFCNQEVKQGIGSVFDFF